MKRTKSAYPHYYHPWGGHMAYPPADCKRLDKVFVGCSAGVTWICNGICNASCGSNPCDRRKEYKAKDEWQKESQRLSAIRKQMRGE